MQSFSGVIWTILGKLFFLLFIAILKEIYFWNVSYILQINGKFYGQIQWVIAKHISVNIILSAYFVLAQKKKNLNWQLSYL